MEAVTHFNPNDPLAKQRYLPRWYRANVLFDVDSAGVVATGATQRGSVTINNCDFVLRRLNAAVIGLANLDYTNPAFPPGSSALDFNVGPVGFTFEMRSDSHVYMSDQVDVRAAIGSNQDYFDTPSPVILTPKTTITFDCTNTLPRTAPTLLQFVLLGVEPANAYAERL